MYIPIVGCVVVVSGSAGPSLGHHPARICRVGGGCRTCWRRGLRRQGGFTVVTKNIEKNDQFR